MKKQKHIIIALVVITLFFLAVIIVQQIQPSKTVPFFPHPLEQQDVQKSVTLALTPAKETVQVGEEFLITIDINTHQNSAGIVQLALHYDPKTIAIDRIDQGTFFTKPAIYANTNDTTIGKITYAIGSFDAKQGTGTIATIVAKALKPTSGKKEIIEVLPATIITQPHTKISVFAFGKGATFVIR